MIGHEKDARKDPPRFCHAAIIFDPEPPFQVRHVSCLFQFFSDNMKINFNINEINSDIQYVTSIFEKNEKLFFSLGWKDSISKVISFEKNILTSLFDLHSCPKQNFLVSL